MYEYGVLFTINNKYMKIIQKVKKIIYANLSKLINQLRTQNLVAEKIRMLPRSYHYARKVIKKIVEEEHTEIKNLPDGKFQGIYLDLSTQFKDFSQLQDIPKQTGPISITPFLNQWK